MLSLIVFGIIAIIVVILLLTFNVRSFNRVGTVQAIQPDAKARLNENHAEIEPEIEHKTSGKNQEEVVDPKKDINRTQMSDQEYRNTLRQHHIQKKTLASPEKHSDEAYRAALRSMRSPKR